MRDSAEAFVHRLLSTHDSGRRAALIAQSSLPPDEGHEAGLSLVDAASRLLGANPLQMESLCADVLVFAEHCHDGYVWALARQKFGDALRAQGRNAEALTCFDQAEARFIELGHPVEAARTRASWIPAAGALGRIDESLRVSRTAKAVLMAHHAVEHACVLANNTGAMLSAHGRYNSALRYFTSAWKLSRELGESGRIYTLRGHANRGLALTRLGRHREALSELYLARDGYRSVGETAGYARVMHRIGENHISLGRYADALQAFDEALPMMRKLGVHADAVTLAYTMADCYLVLNRPDDAIAILAEASDDLSHTDNTVDALGVATRRIAAHLMLGESGEAMAVLNDAESHSAEGATQHRAWLAAQRAALLLTDNATDEALFTAKRAETMARAAGMRLLVTNSLLIQGQALLNQGCIQDAAGAAEKALRFARLANVAPLLQRTHELLGQVAEARGDSVSACRRYLTAIEQLEREQSGVIFEYRDTFARDRGTAFQRLSYLQLESGDAAGSLITAERSKSRALADAISGRMQLRPRGNATVRHLAREIAAAREDYAATSSKVMPSALDSTAQADGGMERLVAIEKRLDGLVKRLQVAGAADQISDIHGAPGIPVMPDIEHDTLLLEYFLCGDDILRFAVDGSGVTGEVLRGRGARVERLLRMFRLNLDSTERAEPDQRARTASQCQTILNRLHGEVFDGLAPLDAYKRLVIIPHGMLHYLPFHALYDGDSYLIERLPISYAPSAAMYGIFQARARRRVRGPALVLAHSARGALPFVKREANAVASVVGGRLHLDSSAKRAVLEEEGRRASLIHIAAHGQFRPTAPLFSGIELADGPITTADVFNLDLRASLVTLSACETGRSVLGGGDELVGLTRAFLYAGAGGLLVSQWRVDDESTSRLMMRFYTELSSGAGRSEALQRAQVDAISANGHTGHHAHPFYWAGLQLIGDNQRLRLEARKSE